MKVEFEVGEAWELMSVVIAKLADEANLTDSDRAKVRRWRSEAMGPGGDGIRALAEKLTADLEETLARKKPRPIRKPSWRR